VGLKGRRRPSGRCRPASSRPARLPIWQPGRLRNWSPGPWWTSSCSASTLDDRRALHRQAGAVGHSPQLPAHRVSTLGVGDQLGERVPGERVAVHTHGINALGLAECAHSVISPPPQPGQPATVVDPVGRLAGNERVPLRMHTPRDVNRAPRLSCAAAIPTSENAPQSMLSAGERLGSANTCRKDPADEVWSSRSG